MKRRHTECHTDQPIKNIKLEPKPIISTLSDDLIYEICTWLPSRFLIKNCLLINSQWKYVIENKVELCLDLDAAEWYDFCITERTINSSIKSLSIRNQFSRNPIDGESFSRLHNLKSLSLRKIRIDRDFMECLTKSGPLEAIHIDRCGCQLHDFSKLDGDACISLRGNPMLTNVNGFYGEDYRFSRLVLLNRHQMESRVPGSIVDGEFDGVGLTIDQLSKNDPSFMKNITSIKIISSSSEDLELPSCGDALTNLREIEHRPWPCGLHSSHSKNRGLFKKLVQQSKNLEKLAIANCESLTNDETEIIPSLTELKSLTVHTYQSRLFEIPLINLRRLELCNSSLSEGQVSNIKGMRSLTDLSIRDVFIEDSCGGESEKGKNRKCFTFPHLCHTNNGIEECNLVNLTSLKVGINRNDRGSLHALSGMSSLTVLKLRPGVGLINRIEYPQFDGTDLGLIAKAPSLTCLKISLISMKKEAIETLSGMHQLRRLVLEDVPLADDHIRQISHMHNLKELSLKCSLSDGKEIEHIQRMENLRLLSVDVYRLPNISISSLALLPSLRFLRLRGARSMDSNIMDQLEDLRNIVDISL